ncbi:MAG: exodeoxyribonuclease III [Bacteroidales bacterium]|jgi:exodeoxyribonuclease-3|nr:exodeoxyribonuclease III [Bacteroidales bacterium]
MKKIISYNVNGIRAAIRKGFVDWLRDEKPDIIQLQEVKAFQEQVDVHEIEELGYTIYWFAAEKRGYSGVATFTKEKPVSVQYGIGNDFFDAEGRFLRLDFEDFTVINSYFPSGTTGTIRQEKKEEYLDIVADYCSELQKTKTNILLSGDFNICHTEKDIHHPERHKGVSGFLPHERVWIDSFLSQGFVDSFRQFHTEDDAYSWWSYRAGSRKKNLGWRIDYHMVSSALSHYMHDAYILPQVVHSDHCPVVVELEG